MKKSMLFVLIISFCNSFSQNFNRLVPPSLYPYEFNTFTSGLEGYYLTTPLKLPNTNVPLLTTAYVIDDQGELVWYTTSNYNFLIDFKYFERSKRWGITKSDLNIYDNARYYFYDENFEVVDSLYAVNARVDIHDIVETKEKGYIINTQKDSLIDLTGYIFNGQPGQPNTVCIGTGIQEFDSNFNLIFDWNPNEYIHPSEVVDGYPGSTDSANFDYVHINSVDKDSLGFYYVSMRHTNCVYKISPSGSIVWRLGGKYSDFTFVNDSGFSGQHDARIKSNGNVSLFDNANTSSHKESRGVEYQLDTTNWTATLIKETKSVDSIYAMAMGNYQQINSGNFLLNYGLLYRPLPSILVLDDANLEQVSISFSDSVVSYRTRFYEKSILEQILVQPEVNCLDSTGNQKLLQAPSGYNHYVWSTGDTTQEIVVTQSGDYKFWVNHGEGMLGSKTISVDVMVSCEQTTSLSDVMTQKKEKIKAIYNLLGEQIPFVERGKVNIIQYTSGRIERKIIL